MTTYGTSWLHSSGSTVIGSPSKSRPNVFFELLALEVSFGVLGRTPAALVRQLCTVPGHSEPELVSDPRLTLP